MVVCPECSSAIDVDEEEIDEGETISCDECGAALKVVSTNPLEIEAAENLEEEEEEDEDFLDEDEEEESEEDWR
jgi:alpha-aminoadipate/glutamate carrier protein LysW